jgi:DNA-binding CsgD family transcriptional regulator
MARALPEGVSELAAARARRAWLATERGTASAAECTSMALGALRDGTLLDAAMDSTAYHRCVGVLIMTDAIDEARDAIAALRYRASTTSEWFTSELALRTGNVTAAEQHAREALEAAGEAGRAFVGAHRVLASALAERGAFNEAHDVLRRLPQDSTALLRARARVALAEGLFQQAYDDACATGTRNARHGRPNPTWDGWRSTAALALAHLGRRQQAAALAETELSEATAFGAPVAIARALLARAVAEPDDRARVTLSQHALGHLSDHPALLETIRLRLELGGALARTGRRVEARDPLRRALANADHAGALLLAQRARRELVATGLRPRRAAIDGPGALTPRQRQICELAAAGKGNRAIAGELFLSLKTVETHLAAAYRKLGVRGRADLAGSLAIT